MDIVVTLCCTMNMLEIRFVTLGEMKRRERGRRRKRGGEEGGGRGRVGVRGDNVQVHAYLYVHDVYTVLASTTYVYTCTCIF